MPQVVRARRAGRLAAPLSALTVVAAALAGCGGDEPYDAALERFDGAHAVENEVVDLPGGDRFSAGSPDGHDVVVQRYDGDAEGWSEPTTIHTEPELWTHELDVSHAGSTAAVSIDYWEEETLDDDYAPRMTIGAVCPDARCTPGVSSGERLTHVSLSDDGGFATFRRADGGYAAWDGGHEWTTEEVGPLPEGADVALAPNGSFVAATGRREGATCRYTLLITAPRGFELVERATATAPYDRDGCEVVVDEVGEDRVALWVEETAGTVEFVRDGDTWQPVALPVSHETVRDTGGRSTLAPFFGRQGPDRVVLYSPDLRTIWSQSWTVYTGVWTQPQEVATLPDGSYCRRGRVVDIRPANGFYAEIDCFDAEDEGLDPSARPTSTVVLRSWNGSGWSGAVVQGAGRFADTGLGFLVAGDPAVRVDMESGQAEEVALPFPEPAIDPFVASADGWVLRVAPRAAGGRCAATVHSAESVTAEGWDEGPSLTVPSVDGGCPPLDAVLRPDGRIVVSDGDGWKITLRRSGGAWRVAR